MEKYEIFIALNAKNLIPLQMTAETLINVNFFC